MMRMRGWPLFVLLIILGGVVLRLLMLSNGIWGDEAITLRALEFYSWRNPLFVGITPDPPLYLQLLKVWSLISIRLEWLRLLSIALGTLSLTICYKLGTLIKNRILGTIFLLLVAFSPLHVYYSHEIRPYALILVLTPLLMYFWITFLRNGQCLANLTITSILGLLTHYTFLLLLPILLLVTIPFLFWKSRKETIKPLAYSFGLILIFGLAFIGSVVSHGYLVSLKEHVPTTVDWSHAFLPLIKIKETLLVYFQFGPFYEYLPPLFFSAGKKLLLLFILGTGIILFTNRKRYAHLFETSAVFGSVVVVGNLLAGYAEFFRLYPYGGRHILPLMFFWFALLSILLYLLLDLNRWLGGAILAVVVFAFVLYSPAFHSKMSFSNGYVEATQLTINAGFPIISFVSPDINSVSYLRSQYGKKIMIRTTETIPSNEPAMVSKKIIKDLEKGSYKIIYANPMENNFLILRK